MKIFLQLRTWIVLILSCFLAVAVISGCDDVEDNRTNRNPPGGNDEEPGKNGSSLNFSFDECDGKECCGEDDACQDICDDGNQLDLGGDERKRCFALPIETVERLKKLFDEAIDDPSPEYLQNLEDKDLVLIGAAFKELGSDLLLKRVKDYSASEASHMMEWLAESSKVFIVFQQTGDELKKIMKELLMAASGQEGDLGVLAGLAKTVNDDDDDDQNILSLALKADNNDLVDYIHDILIDENNEICDDGNHPIHDAGTNAGECGGLETNVDPEKEYAHEACILAAYCKIAPTDNDDTDNDFRERIAAFLNEKGQSRVHRFIKRNQGNAGLNLSEDDADEWTFATCEKLKACWNDGSGLVLGLGSN